MIEPAFDFLLLHTVILTGLRLGVGLDLKLPDSVGLLIYRQLCNQRKALNQGNVVNHVLCIHVPFAK